MDSNEDIESPYISYNIFLHPLLMNIRSIYIKGRKIKRGFTPKYDTIKITKLKYFKN